MGLPNTVWIPGHPSTPWIPELPDQVRSPRLASTRYISAGAVTAVYAMLVCPKAASVTRCNGSHTVQPSPVVPHATCRPVAGSGITKPLQIPTICLYLNREPNERVEGSGQYSLTSPTLCQLELSTNSV